MGKATRRRRHIPRYDPKAAAVDGEDQAETPKGGHKARQQSANVQVRPWLQKLAAPSDGDRIEACKSLSALLAADATNRKALLKSDGAKLLLDRLTDGVDEVRMLAAGALRCVVEDEDCMEEVCRMLFAANVLAILQAQFSKVLDLIRTDGATDVMLAYVDDLIAIALTMIEVSDATLRAVNRQVPVLVDLLLAIICACGTPTAKSLTAAVTAGYCLLTYLEGNDVAIAALNSDAARSASLLSLDVRDTHLSAILAAISTTLLLAQPSHSPDAARFADRSLQTVGSVLDSVRLDQLAAAADEGQLYAAETALETLAKVTCLDDDAPTDAPTLRQYMMQQICSGMLDQITRLCTPVATDAPPIVKLQNGADADMIDGDVSEAHLYPSRLLKIHLYGLDALHNLAWSMLSDARLAQSADWSAKSLQLWQWGLQTLPAILTTDEEVADSALSLVYAVAKYRAGDVPCTTAEVNDLMKLYNSSLNADLQAKVVGLLGALALGSVRDATKVDVNRAAGTFLITCIASLPRTDRECALEALDAVFDVYGDKAYPHDAPVFVKLNFLDHLRKSIPKVRQMRNTTDRRRDPAAHARCAEALENLEAFVAYKAGE